MNAQISVRDLAEFVHRRGDLHARLDGRARAEEGVATQRRLQRDRPEPYERERAVELTVNLADGPVRIAGRIDGCDLGGDVWLVEEFKTTRADAGLAHQHHGSAHWAQVRLYGALLARTEPCSEMLELRLLYCHPDTLDVVTFERRESARALLAFLDETLDVYGAWLVSQRAHRAARDQHILELDFPFAEYRPFQRAMARRAYQAFRDRERLLLEAPTGSGKTAAMLYPAVRALQAAGYRRVIFLTSRSTGVRAARDALARMDPDRGFLRYLSITARDKACFVPGTPCEPDACPYARGYWDRSRPAVASLLERRAGEPHVIAEVAGSHEVCPYELSLDAAVWSDVVIGDYNYLFDPVVRLQRLAGEPDTAVLVDESHQLSPRVRDMLSLSLTRGAVRRALAEAPPDGVMRRLKSIDRQLLKLRRETGAREGGAQGEQRIERPDALLRALQRFIDELATGEVTLEAWPATGELLFTCSRWLRSDAWYDPERFLFTVEATAGNLEVQLICLDPGPWIRERLGAFGGHVRFSGTVSPLDLYQRLHGLPDGAAERAGNPFAPEQLAVLVVDDVPTYLRARQRSLPDLARLVADVRARSPGHCLVAFPSFDYLQRFAEAWVGNNPDVVLHAQTPSMDEPERSAYLDRFRDAETPLLGLVVLGGVFGESVDFPGDRLSAIVCVGVGLPPPSLSRAALQTHFTGQGADGTAVAFHQPAMVKVLQMAGRLLRGPQDRGVLCLVDGRFREAAYARFFPAHWQPEVVRARDLSRRLEDFWADFLDAKPLSAGSSRDFPADFP